MAKRRFEAGLTSVQSPEGRVLLIDNRIDTSPADEIRTLINRGGLTDGYTVISNFSEEDAAVHSSSKEMRLHMYTFLRPTMMTAQNVHFNMIATIAACHAIESHSDYKLGIAWPATVVSGRKKIAEISAESHLFSTGYLEHLIIKTVISLQQSHFPAKLEDIVTSVFTNRNISTADRVAQTYLRDFYGMYENPMASRSALLEEYRHRSVTVGRLLWARVDGKRRLGRAKSIDTAGRLVLGLRKEQTAVISSETQLL
ncbi:MAG: hypothetical protein J6K61_00475 [Clostridia bacterium]|nr:hypothetical protein [Clostridia bacterium]